MKDNYKDGIFHWFGYVLPLEERIKLIKQAGYDYVMLWWEDEVYPHTINRKEFIKILKYYDLKLDNIHLPSDNLNNLWSEDSTTRDKEVKVVNKWLNECKDCGAERVVMHNTQGANHIFNHYSGYDSHKSIISEAERIGIKVAFENTQMLSYTDFLLREISSPNMGFCYDSSHDFVNGGSFGEILNRWKDKLVAVHLSDNDGVCDRHWIPGKGHVQWNKIINIIKQSDIKSYSMEAYPYEEEKNLQPYEFLIKAKRGLQQVMIF